MKKIISVITITMMLSVCLFVFSGCTDKGNKYEIKNPTEAKYEEFDWTGTIKYDSSEFTESTDDKDLIDRNSTASHGTMLLNDKGGIEISYGAINDSGITSVEDYAKSKSIEGTAESITFNGTTFYKSNSYGFILLACEIPGVTNYAAVIKVGEKEIPSGSGSKEGWKEINNKAQELYDSPAIQAMLNTFKAEAK